MPTAGNGRENFKMGLGYLTRNQRGKMINTMYYIPINGMSFLPVLQLSSEIVSRSTVWFG